MDSVLVPGAHVPEFDKQISSLLRKTRNFYPLDDSGIVRIGLRNHDRHIYHHVVAHGASQYADAIRFFEKSGFSALPVDFAQETGLDYVLHRDQW
jgi:hypothetical protein